VMLPISPVYRVDPSGSRVHPAARDLLPPLENECPDNLEGLRILVVDDEADTRELLKQGLEYCGAKVTVVGSAPEALDELMAKVPDVLISDIGMPGIDGYDLIRQVRGLPGDLGGKVPAIVPKPVELAELVAVAATVVRRKN
jgi:PleD family two-component response regulator